MMDEREARAALGGPLQFGNARQIEALRILCPPEINGEGETRYRVDIDVSYAETVYVYAASEEEARNKAQADFDLDRSDVEIEYMVREAKD